MLNQNNQNHWQKYSANWDVISSPLRPNIEEINLLKNLIFTKLKQINSTVKRVMILGVTKDFISLPWEDDTEIIAIDKSSEMIKNIWEKNPHHQEKRKAILGEWQNIPLKDNYFDLVLADGCFTQLNFPESYHQVLKEIKRVLKPQGSFSSRFFLRPNNTPSVMDVLINFQEGKFGNFHLFKLYLAMALQKSTEDGIAVNNVYEVWKQNIPYPEQILSQLGWSKDLLGTINIYENSSLVYSFPTIEEVRELFTLYFRELSCHFPTYEQGILFPTILFEKI